MDTTKYHILDAKGNPTGPFTLQEMLGKDLNENTLIWGPDLGQSWLRMGDVPKMRPVLNGIKQRQMAKQMPPPLPRKAATPPPLPGLRAAAAVAETTVTAPAEAPDPVPDKATKPAAKQKAKPKAAKATKAAAAATTAATADGAEKPATAAKKKRKKKGKKKPKVNSTTWKGESLFVAIVSTLLLLCALIWGDDKSPSHIWLVIGCIVAICVSMASWVLGFRVKHLSDIGESEEAIKQSKVTNIVMQVSFWILAIMTYLALYEFWMWPWDSMQG